MKGMTKDDEGWGRMRTLKDRVNFLKTENKIQWVVGFVLFGFILIILLNNLHFYAMPSLKGYHEVCECVEEKTNTRLEWALDHCRRLPSDHIKDMESYIYSRKPYSCNESKKTPEKSFLCEVRGVSLEVGVVKSSVIIGDTAGGGFVAGYREYDTIDNMCGRLYSMEEEVYTTVTTECVKTECRLVKEKKDD